MEGRAGTLKEDRGSRSWSARTTTSSPGSRRSGFSPEEIDHVVVSHLHFDHAGGLQFFPHATIYVQESELRFRIGPRSTSGVFTTGMISTTT